jgi:predicted O-methyltransferase YrrM
MTDAELGAFFRGLHAGALATGRQLAASEGFTGARSLLDVGGGSGGVAIGACEARPGLTATIVELPRISSIARSFVAEAGLDARIAVLEADLIQAPPAGLHEVGVLRNLLQVLSAEQCRRVVHHVGAAIAPGGVIYIVGHVLEDSRLAPPHAVAMNLVFLNVYDAGASHTEAEHRVWLAEAGFADVEVRYGAGPGNASIIVARKAG